MTINLISNQTKTISVAENQNVLSIAQQQGINMSYACSTGYCGSCKCKMVSGKAAELPISASGISHDEIEQGYTLACQCKPLGDLTLLEVD
ncbi:2Fe-2S iron-sulfur cluster-binding protein [Colwellia sp. RSH04]|uniref:2Fe-2S iron-sulfur cluster-binding protein n=1 Tax=Colwellia sp. RSH04 TaxID=2305464 RepID=UPI000E57FCF4|nr:2Fe-2S iron-sulfur cluster-binding protein [Colwellia sp. RSH04]RHW77397.1 ferredoxin [Colwellia sp. RSH04]